MNFIIVKGWSEEEAKIRVNVDNICFYSVYKSDSLPTANSHFAMNDAVGELLITMSTVEEIDQMIAEVQGHALTS